jgi:hypothetical protein
MEKLRQTAGHKEKMMWQFSTKFFDLLTTKDFTEKYS